MSTEAPQFPGLNFYRSVLQGETQSGVDNGREKTGKDGLAWGTQRCSPAAFGAGLQFTKQHGFSKQLQQRGHAQGRTDQDHPRRPQQLYSAAQEAQQLQTSPLFPVQLQTGRAVPQHRPAYHQQQKSARIAPLRHDISNPQNGSRQQQCWGSGVVTATGMWPLQQANTPLQQQQLKHVANEQLPATTPDQTRVANPQTAVEVPQRHILHPPHQQQQQQQASKQEDSLEDFDIDDTLFAAADAYCSHARAHAPQSQHAVDERSTQQATPGLRQQQQQQPCQQFNVMCAPGLGQQLYQTTPPLRMAELDSHGMQTPAPLQQRRPQATVAVQLQQERQHSLQGFGSGQQPQGQSHLRPGVLDEQQQATAYLQPEHNMQQQCAASRSDAISSCQRKMGAACHLDHVTLRLSPSMQRPEQGSMQQQAWRKFAQQQQQHNRQRRQAVTRDQIRDRCTQLLHRLSLFVGNHDTAATAGAGQTSDTTACKAGSSHSQRWSWLAADRKDAQGRPPGSPGYDPSTLYIPAAALSSMTDFNKQFWGIKSRCMDLVLFVRHGSFYNLFDVDADVGLRVGLNISGVMTANMWKVGCHKDYFGVWCAKVLAQRYSVGRVEEMPRASSNGRKLLVRQLVRIYTPGTAVEGLLADDLDHRARTIMCVTEVPLNTDSSHGKHRAAPACEISACSASTAIGLCIMDVSSGCCQAGIFSTAADPTRSALAAALLVFDPVECIAVRNSLRPGTVTLINRHCEFKGAAQGLAVDSGSSSCAGAKHVPGMSWLPPSAATVVQQPLQLLQQTLPNQALQQLQAVLDTTSSNLVQRDAAETLAVLSAVALAVKQIQRCSLSDDVMPAWQVTALEGLGKSAAQNVGGPLLLDDKAIVTLDLLTTSSSCGQAAGISNRLTAATASSSAAPGSLLEYLDRAASPAGKRLLQQWICRPLTQVSAIEERLDVLDFFITAQEAAASLQARLAALPDADRLLPKAAAAVRSLQEQEQQQQTGLQHHLQQGPGVDSYGVFCPAPAADPADHVALDTRRAAWKALLSIPACLMGLVQALALLRGDAKQHLANTTHLPLLHRALITASKVSRQAKGLLGLLHGAEWRDHVNHDGAAGETGRTVACNIQLAQGADAAYDEAVQQVRQLQEDYDQEVQATLMAYRGSSSNIVQQVVLGPSEEGSIYVVAQTPVGGTRSQQGFGSMDAVRKPTESVAWAQHLLLDESHCIIKQERLADSEVAGLVDGHSLSTAAAGRGKGARGRGSSRGRGGRGVGRAAGPDAMVVQVHVPLLQQLAGEVQQAQRQLETAAAAALQGAGATFLESYTAFRSLVKAVSELDVLAGFAQVVRPGSQPPGCCFCRPRFAAASAAAATMAMPPLGASPLLQLQGLWHPLLPASAVSCGDDRGSGGVVCNDIQLGGNTSSAMLLTGANMGGKSTLLRSTCIAVIMAQIGCYVPATGALLDPVDAIFTRIGAADAIMCGLSTFMVEMRETAACLAAATPASLIVLDELGRGTSTHDGYALAYAVLKHLAAPEPQAEQQTEIKRGAHEANTSSSGRKPRLLFATHYHNLTCEPDLAGCAQSWHMATEFNADVGHLVHLYQLRPGAAPAGSCGIEVAALAGLPTSVVHRATQVAAAVQKSTMVGAGLEPGRPG